MSIDVSDFGRNAIRWALDRMGSTDYATRCLAFVEDAVERSNGVEVFGGDDAAESSRLYGADAAEGEPSLGAFVFYESVGEWFGDRRDWGHVGLSLGDGRVVHAWDVVRVDDYRELVEMTPAPGWEPLSYVGWTPLERVLEGSRPRDWAGDAVEAARRMQTERFDSR